MPIDVLIQAAAWNPAMLDSLAATTVLQNVTPTTLDTSTLTAQALASDSANVAIPVIKGVPTSVDSVAFPSTYPSHVAMSIVYNGQSENDDPLKGIGADG